MKQKPDINQYKITNEVMQQLAETGSTGNPVLDKMIQEMQENMPSQQFESMSGAMHQASLTLLQMSLDTKKAYFGEFKNDKNQLIGLIIALGIDPNNANTLELTQIQAFRDGIMKVRDEVGLSVEHKGDRDETISQESSPSDNLNEVTTRKRSKRRTS